jgi:hypothetical protein
MRNEIVEPFLTHEQAGPFILEADSLIANFHLRDRLDDFDMDFLLGPKLGLLSRRQVVCLMSRAIGRLIQPQVSPATTANYWVNETILALYIRFSARLLAEYPHQPEEYTSVLPLLLDAVIGRRLGKAHKLPYERISFGVWEYAVDNARVVLENEFPPVPRHGPLDWAPADGYESECGWIEDLADQLRLSLSRSAQSKSEALPAQCQVLAAS